MVKFEQILIDPSPGEVAECLALAAAAADAGARERKLGDQPAKWRTMALDCSATEEGHLQENGAKHGVPASILTAAWWTDAVRRKHVAIRARRLVHPYERPLLYAEAFGDIPPLAKCYPGRVHLHTSGGISMWAALCDCGVYGTPETIGWVGERCGACNDRVLEGADTVRAGLARPMLPGLVRQRFALSDTHLAALDRTGFTVWPLTGGVPIRIDIYVGDGVGGFFFTEPYTLVWMTWFSRSDRRVFACDIRDPGRVAEFRVGLRGLAVPGPTPGTVFAISETGVDLYDIASGQVVRHFPTPAGQAKLVTLSRCRRAIALSILGTVLGIDIATGKQVFRVVDGSDVGRPAVLGNFLSFSLDDQSLWTTNNLTVYRYGLEAGGTISEPAVTSILRAPHPEYGSWFPHLLFPGDKRKLVAVSNMGEFFLIDPMTLALASTLEWPYKLGAARYGFTKIDWSFTHLSICSAESPSGRYVATADVEGAIKLWDLDRLLPAVAPP